MNEIRIIYSSRFQKNYAKLPKKIREQFDERLKIFCSDSKHPLLRDHALKGNFIGLRAFSISGDYRAIYRAMEPNIILLGDIGTHSQVYE